MTELEFRIYKKIYKNVAICMMLKGSQNRFPWHKNLKQVYEYLLVNTLELYQLLEDAGLPPVTDCKNITNSFDKSISDEELYSEAIKSLMFLTDAYKNGTKIKWE